MSPDEIREWREARSMSQVDLARALSADGTLSQVAVHYWESGKRTPPPYLRLALERLARKHRPTR